MTSLTVTFLSQPNATELEGQCGVDGLPVPRDAQLHPLLLRPQRGGNGQRALKHKVPSQQRMPKSYGTHMGFPFSRGPQIPIWDPSGFYIVFLHKLAR